MQSNPKGGTPDPAKLEVHPAVELFPLIEGAEFQELVEDIRASGLRTPIVLDRDGRLLDGRNRLRACRAAGVEPRFETWDGSGSPFELVVSLNLRRRHLNESQRAMVAARLRESLAGEARRFLKAEGITSANLRSGKSAEQAAAMLNVSPRSVEHAAKILRAGDGRLILLVESGKLAVSAAASESKPKSRRARRSIPAPVPGEAVLALWAPPGRVDEVAKLVEQWGFEQRAVPKDSATPEPQPTLLIARRRNPVCASEAPAAEAGGKPGSRSE